MGARAALGRPRFSFPAGPPPRFGATVLGDESVVDLDQRLPLAGGEVGVLADRDDDLRLLLVVLFGEASLLVRLQHAYTECLPEVALTSDQQAAFLAWCLDVVQRRVDAIVRNQHRGSYDRAALLLASCTEVLRLLGKAQKARALLGAIRQQFRRHRAFQVELQAAVQRMGA